MRHISSVLLLASVILLTVACSHTKPIVPSSFPFQLKDVNRTQLAAAQQYGLKQTVKNRSQLDRVTDQLVRIADCEHYRVDHLTHSVPYLTHGASRLLSDIGREFQKSLKRYKIGKYRIIVTSVLRTEEDVTRLMKTNRNAVKKSTHQYATTFDITYSRFDHVSGTTATPQQLKYVLGEVLSRLRSKGRCYVMYETAQHCFHITSRK